MTSKTKGVVGSAAIHIILIVLLIVLGFSTPLPLPEEQGILVSFGTSEQGMGPIEPRIADPAPTPPPPSSRAEVVETPPLTQDFEEAPAIAPPKVVSKPETRPEPIREEKPQEVVEEKPTPVEEKPRQPNQMALFPGRRSDGGTQGEGETSTPGNQGQTHGSPHSAAREGATGGGDGISFDLGGRASLTLPMPDYPTQKSGRVVVQVTVDRQGNVTKAVPGARGSTTLDAELLRAAERAALLAKFDVSANAPAYQTGTITYVFRLRQ